MAYRSIIQILLIIISIVIITTYINPTFKQMRATQDETGEYKKALESAESFNAELQRLLREANSFSTTERRALERYLPDSVDTIAIMKDIETIVSSNSMELTALSSNSLDNETSSQVNAIQDASEDERAIPNSFVVETHTFILSVQGTYDQFKALLRDLERNAYPLEIANISFSSSEDIFYSFSLEIETYSLNESAE